MRISNGEGRAEPLFALDADLAVHHLHDAPGDRYAEAAAAVAVRAEQRRKLQHEGEGEDELEDAAQNARNAQQARGRAEAQPCPRAAEAAAEITSAPSAPI